MPCVRINTTITIPLINKPNRSVASHAISVRCSLRNFARRTEVPCPIVADALISRQFTLNCRIRSGNVINREEKKKTFKVIDALESSCRSRIYAKYSIWPINWKVNEARKAERWRCATNNMIFFPFVWIRSIKNSEYRHLPRSTLHEVLSAKYHQHVNAAIVKHPCPIFHHPNACVLVYEFVFEIENVRIVWRQFHRVLCGLFAVWGLLDIGCVDLDVDRWQKWFIDICYYRWLCVYHV